MDKKGIIRQHSKIKLDLYRLYLTRYLPVLLASQSYNRLHVIDVFAGSGISENDEEGSAVVAAKAIEEIAPKWGKTVLLKLNDADAKNCADLEQHVKNYTFASVTCGDADTYIRDWAPDRASHSLIFIDPHGYTQVSPANLRKLFSTRRADFLIFIPIYHIYRFLNPSDERGDAKGYYEPIAKFLSGLGIDEAAARAAKAVEEFAQVVRAALRKISGSSFVYCEIIQNRDHNSKYALFFVSHHILGAQKFLEAQSALKQLARASAAQKSFDFGSDDAVASIARLANPNRVYDNTTLYELGINEGILPPDLRAQLVKLEKSGKIKVNAIPGKERINKAFYLSYDHYKQPDKRIYVSFRS